MHSATVTDHIGSDNMSYDQSTPIKVMVYETNPNDVWNDRYVKEVTIPWSDVRVAQDGKTITYSLPGDVGQYKYVISYNTKVTVDPNSIADTTVTNTARVDGPQNGETTGKGTVGPANDVNLQKKVVKATASTVEWEYSFKVPASGLTEAVLTDYYPKRANQYVDELDTTYPISVVIEQQKPAEDWTINTDENDRMTVTFTNNGQPGLAGTGTERTVTVKLRTKYNETWLNEAPTEGHQNIVKMNDALEAQATVTPGVDQGLSKEASSIGKITLADGKAHPVYKYTLTLSGVSGDVEILDTFDKDLAYFNIFDYLDNETIKSQFGDLGISLSDDEVFYSQNDTSGKRVFPNDYPVGTHPLNNGNYSLGYTFVTGTSGDNNTITFTVPFNKLPTNAGVPYNTYSIVYYLIADDLDSLNKRSKTADNGMGGQGGPVALSNTAEWTGANDGTSTAEVEYQYPVLDKSMIGLGEDAKNGTVNRDPVAPSRAFAKFQIIVNPDRATMPLDPEKNKVKLTDSYENLSVDYSTVKIETEDDSGNRSDVTRSTEFNYSGNTGTFYLENETKYVITYMARIIGEGVVDFNNTARIDGYSSTVEESADVQGSGGGQVENYWVRIYKQEGNSMNKPLAGATYTLVYENGDPMVYPQSAKNDKVGQPISFTTGADGLARVFLSEETDGISLQKGIKYFIKETEAPPGYQISTRIYNFTISDHPNYNNSVNYEYYTDDIMRFRDNPEKGVLEIKKGVTIDGVDSGNNLTDEQKKNIKFTISGTRTDGEAFDPVTVSYDQFTSDSYRLENLEPGTYTVTETNYNLEGLTHTETTATVTSHNERESVDGYTFTFTIPQNEEPNTEHVVSYENTYQSTNYTLRIKKKGPDNEPLYGAEFKLEVKNGDDYVPVANGSLDADGKFTIPYEAKESGVTIYSLADGEYRLTETKAPNGYRATAGEWTFTIADHQLTSPSGGDKISYVAGDNNSGTVTVTNTKEFGYTITKAEAGATTTRLPGAEFTVYKYNSGGTDTVIDELKTDENGQFEILKSNTTTSGSPYVDNTLYYLVETKAPTGYLLKEDKLYFHWGTFDHGNAPAGAKIVNLGSAQVYDLVEDEPKNINIRVKKVWEGMDSIPTDSIQFKVFRTETTGSTSVKKQYPDNDTVFTLTKGNNETTTWTTVDKANLLKNLPVGKSEDGVHTSYAYSVEEISKFEGLESKVTIQENARDGDGNYDIYTITNKPESAEITIHKVWVDASGGAEKETQTVVLCRKNSQGEDTGFSWPWNSPYAIEGGEHGNFNYGKVEITLKKVNNWKATISSLEKGPASDPWLYYVEEPGIPQDYTFSASEPVNSGTITVTNTKKTTGIAVHKVWDLKDGEEVPENVTVQLMKAGEKIEEDAAHIQIYAYTNYGSITPGPIAWDQYVSKGSEVRFKINGSSGDIDDYNIIINGAELSSLKYERDTYTYILENVSGNITVGVKSWGYGKDLFSIESYETAVSPDISSGSVANISNPVVTLGLENHWYHEWPSLDDGYYYIVETKVGDKDLSASGYAVTYSENNNGIKSGTITVTNTKTEPQTGSLKLTKVVHVDDQAPETEAGKNLVNGNYIFTVSSDNSIIKYVQITVSNGEPTSYKIADTQAGLDSATVETGATAIISGLDEGDYVITEIEKNGMTLKEAARGDKNTDAVSEEKAVTVHVTAGQDNPENSSAASAAFTNNIETVTAKVVKEWNHTGNNGTRPTSLTVTLSNGETRVLNNDNNWTAEVNDLPKYDSTTGNKIEYSWTEAELPEGYYLSNIQETTDTTTGVITTTLTNSYTDHYNPTTTISGKKVWDDGGMNRPNSITVNLYKDGGTDPFRTTTVQKPTGDGANQDEWPFEFTNLPVFNDDGSVIQYTVDEVLPEGYTDEYGIKIEFSQATYTAGDTTGKIVNSGQGSQTFKISDGFNLGYIVIRHGNDFIIWTPRPAADGEISAIKTKVVELSDQFNGINTASGSSMKIVSGVPDTVDVGKKHAVSVYMQGGEVWMKFLNPNAWSDFAYGTIPYTYTQAGGEGGGTITNTKKNTDFNFGKQWIDISQQEIDWDQDIQVTVSRNKGDNTKDAAFSLVYNISKSAVDRAADGTVEFSPKNGIATDPKLKLTITTEGETKKYSFKIQGLAYSSDSDGKYTYYVEETNSQLEGYLAPSYTNPSAPTGAVAAYDGGVIINKQEGGYELPSTGGPGTWIYILLGGAISVFAVLLLRNRRLKPRWKH